MKKPRSMAGLLDHSPVDSDVKVKVARKMALPLGDTFLRVTL